ncbi:MAG: hypothetical protein HFH68_12005 [Lachnospiraceae bacterium]|nr:hypothetical protein [Lachnospiraceae bacterium]
MYFKDYSEPYAELQDSNIEILLKDINLNEIEEKIIIWEGDFDSILSEIPLNKDGEYAALAYHQNIDFPWEKLEPGYWVMDYLNESLKQLEYVKSIIEDDMQRDICKDICRIINNAINNGKLVLIKRI